MWHLTRPSRPIRCAVWIVERIRYRPTNRPTDRPTNQRTQPVIEVLCRTYWPTWPCLSHNINQKLLSISAPLFNAFTGINLLCKLVTTPQSHLMTETKRSLDSCELYSRIGLGAIGEKRLKSGFWSKMHGFLRERV